MCLIKLLPLVHISVWLWIWIAVIAVIKATNIVWGFVCRKKLVDYHSVFNKATGLLLFLLPFTLQRVEPKYSFAVVCIIATIAAIQEGYYIEGDRLAEIVYSFQYAVHRLYREFQIEYRQL